MQTTFSSDLSVNQLSSDETDTLVVTSAPVELDASLLSHVGGGLGPNDSWGSNVTAGPNDSW